MLQPNPGMLLKTLRNGLKTEVLPALERESGPGRQLRASLYLIARLEQSWDLYHQHVQKDNRDLEETLRAILGKLVSSRCGGDFERLLNELETANLDKTNIQGINDPELINATRINLVLQGIASRLQRQLGVDGDMSGITMECSESLRKLYQRMAERDVILVGEEPAKN